MNLGHSLFLEECLGTLNYMDIWPQCGINSGVCVFYLGAFVESVRVQAIFEYCCIFVAFSVMKKFWSDRVNQNNLSISICRSFSSFSAKLNEPVFLFPYLTHLEISFPVIIVNM